MINDSISFRMLCYCPLNGKLRVLYEETTGSHHEDNLFYMIRLFFNNKGFILHYQHGALRDGGLGSRRMVTRMYGEQRHLITGCCSLKKRWGNNSGAPSKNSVIFQRQFHTVE